MPLSISALLKTKAEPLLIAREMYNNNAGHSRCGAGGSTEHAQKQMRDQTGGTGAHREGRCNRQRHCLNFVKDVDRWLSEDDQDVQLEKQWRLDVGRVRCGRC